jgi:hypothetical protein
MLQGGVGGCAVGCALVYCRESTLTVVSHLTSSLILRRYKTDFYELKAMKMLWSSMAHSSLRVLRTCDKSFTIRAGVCHDWFYLWGVFPGGIKSYHEFNCKISTESMHILYFEFRLISLCQRGIFHNFGTTSREYPAADVGTHGPLRWTT